MSNVSVWTRIARLRQRDPHLLAPAVMRAWDRGRMKCQGLHVNVADANAPEDLVPLGELMLVETLRVQELQTIYYAQRTTKQSSVLRSWHAYGLAFDVVHREYLWFSNRAAMQRWPNKAARERAAVRWFRGVAGILTHGQQLAWGGLWKTFPDSPHFQAARVPVVVPASTEALYLAAGGDLPGRQAVWAHYGLDT